MNIKFHFSLFIALSILLDTSGIAAQIVSSPSSTNRPNILIILADDFGYADLNINNPAAKSPTPNLNALAESGIRFTRHYTESTCSPSRAALITGSYPSRINFKPNGFGIPPEVSTLPKAFKAAGYRTHHIGKWHLGHLIPETWPNAQGFDTSLGFLNQWLMANSDRENGFHYGQSTHLNAYLQNERGEIKQFPGHLTDVTSDEAIRLIKAGKTTHPWLIYLASFAPHQPIEPRADYASRFPDTPAGRYAALIAHLDERIADIIKALEDTGQRDNTIVVFASDNGGANRYLDSNAPFIGKKTEYLEGGIRTPFLISWPGKISAHRTSSDVVSIMDIYPSLATLARVATPEKLDGRTLFTARGALIKLEGRPLYWDTSVDLHRKYSVLSADGRWRLYQDWVGDPSLFDLNQDPISAVNVAAAHPETITQLRTQYEHWAASVAHIPLHIKHHSKNGQGVLTGDPLQRASTFADFTVAIGVTPKQTAVKERVIIEQKPTLRISEDLTGLHIRFNGLNADLPPLSAAQCTSLVMTGTFNRKIESTDFGNSTLNIYLNSNKKKTIKQDVPLLGSININAATYIGISADSSHRFDGILSAPIYLNRRADAFSPPEITIDSLAKEVCPTKYQ